MIEEFYDNNLNLYGFTDSDTKEVIIKPQFTKVGRFTFSGISSSHSYCPVCNEDGKWGIINTIGEFIADYQYDDISIGEFGWGNLGGIDQMSGLNYSESTKYAQVKLDGRIGLLDLKSGQEIIECKYTSLNMSKLDRYGIIFTEIGGKFGIVDAEDNPLCKNKYSKADVMTFCLAIDDPMCLPKYSNDEEIVTQIKVLKAEAMHLSHSNNEQNLNKIITIKNVIKTLLKRIKNEKLVQQQLNSLKSCFDEVSANMKGQETINTI